MVWFACLPDAWMVIQALQPQQPVEEGGGFGSCDVFSPVTKPCKAHSITKLVEIGLMALEDMFQRLRYSFRATECHQRLHAKQAAFCMPSYWASRPMIPTARPVRVEGRCPVSRV